MKKLILILLCMTVAICLCACPAEDEPIDTDPQNSSSSPAPSVPTSLPAQPEQQLKLVSTYQSKALGNLNTLWPDFMLTFSYREDLTGGTVNLSGQDQESLSGEFTCDENHRITNIVIYENQDTMNFQMKYDDCDRVTEAKITMVVSGQEKLILHTQDNYNEAGKNVYSYVNNAHLGQLTISESVYNEAGLTVETVQQTKIGDMESYTKTAFTYDGFAIASATVFDKDGNQMGSVQFQKEVVDGVTYSTMTQGEQTIRYGFDENGKAVLTEISMGDTVISRNENTYNEKGQIIKAETFSGGTTTVYEYEYDQDGDRTAVKLQRDGQKAGYLYTNYITVTP